MECATIGTYQNPGKLGTKSTDGYPERIDGNTQCTTVVIAVDLNSGVVSHQNPQSQIKPAAQKTVDPSAYDSELLNKMVEYYEHAETSFTSKINELLHRESSTPDIIETVMTSINIMQERIARINLAVEPPDVLIQPRLGQLKMMDFDQVEQTIEEGYISVKEKIADIKKMLE